MREIRRGSGHDQCYIAACIHSLRTLDMAAACGLAAQSSMQSEPVLPYAQEPDSLEINAYWTHVQRGWAVARYFRPRCASSATFALISAKARPSRLGGGRGSLRSLERPSRFLPPRQAEHLANKGRARLKKRPKSPPAVAPRPEMPRPKSYQTAQTATGAAPRRKSPASRRARPFGR